MLITRRRNLSVFKRRRWDRCSVAILDESDSARSSAELIRSYPGDVTDLQDDSSNAKHLSKRRRCCGIAVLTPNTSRFSNHLHSRILQKFPFLIEMFYWIITYLFYRMTKTLSKKLFTNTVWEVAQNNGLAVLEIEQFSWLSFLFPYQEHDVQQWFMQGHSTALTSLNRVYALIHVPATVG